MTMVFMKKHFVSEIFGKISPQKWNNWRWQAANRLQDVSRLAEWMNLPPQRLARLAAVAGRYPFCVTPYYLSLCDANNPHDPILNQIMPDPRELVETHAPADPFLEKHRMPVPGLIRRYRNRVLVIVSGECAVRCRYCTRKNMLMDFIGESIYKNVRIGRDGSPWPSSGRPSRPYTEERMLRPPASLPAHIAARSAAGGCEALRAGRGIPTLISRRLPAIIKYIRAHPQIREVILSGGDPLLLETVALDRILSALRSVKTVEVFRIGTRVPVVLPMRIDAELCECLKKHRPIWVNTQFNHPDEITPASTEACRRLQEAGLPVSNQAVLLRGVNDSLPVLEKLCNDLQRIMVRPYYVFQCDPVRGTSHFRVPLMKAVNLAKRLRMRLGGLSMPLFVADVPGKKHKIPLETVKIMHS
jgi:lysine 2,3-aminomutase